MEMTKQMGREMVRAFIGSDLKTIREEMEGVQGAWNGEDSQFMHEGELYHEDDASAAGDIIEKIDALQEELNEWRGGREVERE